MFSYHRVPLPPPVTGSDSLAYAADAENYVRRIRENYDARANGHRRYYRASGILVIVAGASLPILTTLDYEGKELAVSLIGVLVSVVTALRAFYRWDQIWALLRVTEFSVSQAYWEWRRSIDGRLDATDAVITDKNREATALLLEKVAEIRSNEAISFFKDLPFPQKHYDQR